MSASLKPVPLNLPPHEFLANATFEEARDYLEFHPEQAEKIYNCAEYVLAAIRTLPFVAIHGQGWERRFNITPEDSALDAINRIYAVLQESLLKHNQRNMFYGLPRACISLESFLQTYEQELSQRIQKFCVIWRAHMQIESPEEAVLEAINFYTASAGEEMVRSLSAYAVQNQKTELKQLLWSVAKEADYWEAIPFLVQSGIPASYAGDLPVHTNQPEWLLSLWRNSNQTIKELTYSQARAFADQNCEISSEIEAEAKTLLRKTISHPWVQVWGDQWQEYFDVNEAMTALHTVGKIYDKLYLHLARWRTIPPLDIQPPQLHFGSLDDLFKIEQTLRMRTCFGTLRFEVERRQDPSLREFIRDQYKTHPLQPNDHTLFENLCIEAKKGGWGSILWHATANSNYWEAIPILCKAGIALPEEDALAGVKHVAAQNKSLEWLYLMSHIAPPQQ